MPSLGTSFSSQGATPQQKYSFSPTSASGSTPQAKALNSFSNNTSTTPYIPSTLVSTQKATTPLKKQTVTTPTGHTVTSEYHAPDQPSTVSTGSSKGLITPPTPTTPPANNTGVTGGYTNPTNQAQQSSGLLHDQNLPPQSQGITPSTTYPGMIQSTAGASANAVNAGASNYGTANKGLLDSTAGNQQYADRAKQITDEAGKQISDIGTLGARSGAGQSTTGTSPVAEGNAAVTAQTTAAQQRAVTEGANMQLTGNAQGLTANQQTQSGYNNASGNALNSQGQGISGLGSSAGMLSPSNSQFSTTPGQTVYDSQGKPIAGGFGGQNGDKALTDLATSVANGSMGYDQAITTMGAYASDPATVLALQNAIKQIKPDFNIAQSNSQVDVTGDMTKTYQEGLNKLTAANNIEPQIVKTLTDNPELNRNPISAVNLFKQMISGQFSDPTQQQLASQVSSYISALGMTPEQANAIAVQKGGTIGALLKTLKDNFVAQNEGNNPKNVTKGSSSSSSSTANPWH